MDEKCLWQPRPQSQYETNFSSFYKYLKNLNLDFNGNYEDLWKWSIENKESFWLNLFEYFDISYTGSRDPVISSDELIYNQKFFQNIKLSYAENIINHLIDEPVIYINETGYKKILHKNDIEKNVAKLSHYLKSKGVKYGDRVAAIAGNTPETLISFLAVNTIGAIWSSCSPDFGENAILDRFGQIKPKVLMASYKYFYGGKKFEITEKIQNVITKIDSIETSILINYLDEEEVVPAICSVQYNDIIKNPEYPHELSFEKVNFNDPMYILYSSGTTGKPKCIVHNTGGPLIQHLKEHHLHCDIKENDTVFYFTTCGWMMWNWLVSVLASKAKIILYEGSPFSPKKDTLLNLIKEEDINIFGASAKYLDSLRNEEINYKAINKLESLRCILSTGSPLISDTFNYVYENIKSDVHLASISGGTDIVSCFVVGNPNLPVFPGEIQCKCLGVDVDVFDEHGQSTLEKGELVCKNSLPSMPIGFWEDEQNQAYINTYFKRYFNTWSQGDFAKITNNNGIVIYGRSDATLNPGGIRIGTAEIYRSVEAREEILESVAVGQKWKDDVRIILFVKLAPGFVLDENLINDVKNSIRQDTSVRHVPAKILEVSDIPRTKSGKIVELTIRDIINGEKPKNLNAIDNSECLVEYQNRLELTD
mgnify:FL=1